MKSQASSCHIFKLSTATQACNYLAQTIDSTLYKWRFTIPISSCRLLQVRKDVSHNPTVSYLHSASKQWAFIKATLRYHQHLSVLSYGPHDFIALQNKREFSSSIFICQRTQKSTFKLTALVKTGANCTCRPARVAWSYRLFPWSSSPISAMSCSVHAGFKCNLVRCSYQARYSENWFSRWTAWILMLFCSNSCH
jgi:hypothetical protein